MKTKIMIIIVALLGLLYAVTTYADTVTIKQDTCISKVTIDTSQVNVLIGLTEMDDSTKHQLKEIINETPEVAESARDIISIIQGKEQYSGKLEFIMTLIGSIITFVTLLAGVVRKVRMLPKWLSPIYWFNKLMGDHKGKVKEADGTILKGVYKSVFIPDGHEVEIKKTT